MINTPAEFLGSARDKLVQAIMREHEPERIRSPPSARLRRSA